MINAIMSGLETALVCVTGAVILIVLIFAYEIWSHGRDRKNSNKINRLLNKAYRDLE